MKRSTSLLLLFVFCFLSACPFWFHESRYIFVVVEYPLAEPLDFRALKP